MSQINKCDYDVSYCEKKQGKPTRTELKCGSPSFVAFPNLTAAGTTVTIATLSIDASEFEHPHIQLSFTANVSTDVIDGFSFQIFRQCLDPPTPIPVSEIYYYTRAVATTEADSINFTVCDNDFCINGCCNYFVVITVTVSTVSVSYISNATLSAIISDNINNC
ncbi:protein of unknown function [Lacrimispora sphenoides]|jgi:hypothetical protein|uniref:DUF4489 domain-containing protein n=1 Tax=Lacrimispora sphenoides TaxID=29370 RepID=UPI0008B5B6FD|nr:DUF4489 domain-containing protein [Lacrimispora sphenoides]SEU26985.1 protein of unknown function [Lacrimispora sphenoides]